MDHFFRLMNEAILDYISQGTSDENLIENTMNRLIENEIFLNIKRESKNEETAKNKLEEGNKMISSAPLDKLIEIYSEAIAYALHDSELLARGFANRSAALTNGGMYEDSLKDIERAFEIGYPDNLKAKLYARKAKNLLALNSMMRSEVDDAITQAKIWAEKMDDDNKKIVKKSLEQLKTDKSFKKPFKFWKSSEFLPKTPDDNPKILRASGSIDIKKSKTFGRHIVATKDIKAGETLWVHRSYAFSLKSECRYRYCWNCARYTLSSVPCNQCSNVIYCNEKCRDIAWHEHHDVECPAITAVLAINIDNEEKCLLEVRLLVKALKEFGTVNALHEKIKEIDLIENPILKLFTGNVYDDTKYASVYSLFRLKSNPVLTEGLAFKIVGILFLLVRTTEILGKRYDDPTELMNNKWAVFIGNLMFRHMEIIQTNSIDMFSNNRQGSNIKCGSFLAPLEDLCSHSCDRNTYPLSTGDINATIAVQPIKKGQQIYLTYGPYFQELPAFQRKQFILMFFKFWCQCTACINDWGPNYRHVSCVDQLPEKTTYEFIKILRKCNTHIPIIKLLMKRSTKDITSSKIIEIISDLSKMLNTIGSDRYPCKEIVETKLALFEIFNCIAGYI
ncbi:SET and MYND domain-containing protein 4-like [Microplitis mediator]|uniref:SET and MYND domain-containing protein 4-like n=1 Tax=Microplitis mediator TaxID=375433 RepID=UPI002555AD71|nr:SET and MYND domain-containing protein 4-like [Microplitis mediator]XP_057331816.1 SET and MYND domain-containing protein 4-like [Microplitis mediator]XP_057331817.1 SET and MYND domain-containing protein 4-like [Microplitis mediator]